MAHDDILQHAASDSMNSSRNISRAMPEVPIAPERFDCPHEDCIATFNNIRRLRHHKATQHDYCSFHDLDFPDWDSLLTHKIESCEHITCPFCGMDFLSLSGRERHVAVSHPKQQRCDCPGCENWYTNASALMYHIENNLCNNITWAQYMKIYMKNSLLAGHIESLSHPTSKTETKHTPHTKSNIEFPLLDKTNLARLANHNQKLGSINIKEQMKRDPENEELDNELGSVQCTSLIEYSAPPYSSHNSPETIKKSKRPRDEYLLDSDIKENVKMKPLLPLADLPLDRNARMKRLGRMMWGENAIERLNNIIAPKDLPNHMNPFSEQFNIETFKKLGKYRCPNVECSKIFADAEGLTAHLRSPAHHKWDARCPQCFAIFKGAAALVSHMEGPSFRCKIKESLYFKDALEVATSGFIRYEKKGNEHIFIGAEPAVV